MGELMKNPKFKQMTESLMQDPEVTPSQKGTTWDILRMLTWKPRPEFGLDCLMSAACEHHPAPHPEPSPPNESRKFAALTPDSIQGNRAALAPEKLVFRCRTTSASTAPRTPRRTCCPYAYVLLTVTRVSRSCDLFLDGFDLHLRPTPRNDGGNRALLPPN